MSTPRLKWEKLKRDGKIVPRVIVSDVGFYKICRVTVKDDDKYRPSRNGEWLGLDWYKTVREAQQVCERHYAINGDQADE